MFIVLYLTGFFLEKKPCTICSIVSQMFAHLFIVKCLPIWGIYRGDGVNLLLWLWLLSVLELLSAAGDVRPSYRQKTFQVFVLQDVEYSCQPRQDQHWDCLLLISDSGSVTRLWDRQHPPGSSYSSTWHVNINTDKLYYNDTTTHLHWAWCDSSLHTFCDTSRYNYHISLYYILYILGINDKLTLLSFLFTKNVPPDVINLFALITFIMTEVYQIQNTYK